jgi:hypothetical protein
MDIVTTWTEKIAREVTPDEVGRAKFVAREFMKGGRARKNLLQKSGGGVLGGFGAEFAPLLPWILQAISVTAPFLYGLLASGVINNSIDIIKEMREFLDRHKEKQNEKDDDGKDPPIPTALITSLPLELQRAIEMLSDTMKESKNPPERRKLASCAVIILMAYDIPGATQLTQDLKEKK